MRDTQAGHAKVFLNAVKVIYIGQKVKGRLSIGYLTMGPSRFTFAWQSRTARDGRLMASRGGELGTVVLGQR